MARAFNQHAVNGDTATGVAAAGTTQATATVCPADHVLVETSTAGQGVILKEGTAGAWRTVTNATANAILVYPWVGAGFNGQAANGAVNLPPYYAAWFICFSPTKISTNF